MAVRVNLSPDYYEYTNNRGMIEVEGTTIRECLDSLICLFPVFKALFFGSDHALSALIIHDEELITPCLLDRPVVEGREISIRPMVYGG